MLEDLMRHLAWADRRTADALDSVPGPPPELVRLLAHIVGAERVWIERLHGGPTVMSAWPDLDLMQSRQLAGENHAAVQALAAEVVSGARAEPVRYANSRGDMFTNSASEILHHVAMHGMYHRGQIMLGVRQAGGTPLATDFIVYAREGGRSEPR